MLPKNDQRVIAHATGGSSDPSLLAKFRTANPQLIPVKWNGRGIFCEQLWHFTFLNHREYSERDDSAHKVPKCCSVHLEYDCVADHEELWQDRTTHDLVHIAHPYCDGSDDGYREGRELLRRRGLNSAMSSESWYYPGHSNLVVAARPKTFERIVLDNVLHLWDTNEERDAERIVAAKKATEEFDADQWFADAEKAEFDGDYNRAVLIFVDNAYIERTGRFHRRAVNCLRRAALLLRDHYNDTVVTIVGRSFLTRREVRIVFQFAGMAVPDWLERIWRNNRRPDSWKYRWDVPVDGGGLTDLYRCVVCEEWVKANEGIDTNSGLMHSINGSYKCLARAAGVPNRSEL